MTLDACFQVIKESLLVVLVRLETEGNQVMMDPQVMHLLIVGCDHCFGLLNMTRVSGPIWVFFYLLHQDFQDRREILEDRVSLVVQDLLDTKETQASRGRLGKKVRY